MERKFVKPSKLAIYLLLTVITGCGYSDNDKVIVEKKIVGNFKLIRLENSEKYDLTFSETSRTNAIMIQNCKRVFYDSIRHSIYIESVLNKYNLNYYEVHILKAEATSFKEASEKTEIKKEEFDSFIHGLPLFFNDTKLN